MRSSPSAECTKAHAAGFGHHFRAAGRPLAEGAMHLEGSCHCGAVRFSVEAQSPVPFMHCHCSICRKTADSGGFAINLGAKAATLKVRGEKHLGRYHALLREPGKRT